MGMLDRYKKKGGFNQLLNLIETSNEKKRIQFLALVAQESPAWARAVTFKMLTVDRIFSWPKDVLSEVLSRIQPLTLGVTLIGRADDRIEEILSPLNPLSKRKISELMADLKPSPSEKTTCEMKLISEVRAIAAAGYIKFEKFDPDLFIEETIEDRLALEDLPPAYLEKEEPALQTKDSPYKNVDLEPVDPKSVPSKTAVAAKDTHTPSYQPGLAAVESEALKRRINQLLQENGLLKAENQVLNNKLQQIRKIA
ncbi:MAG: hypothetical protein EOP06_13185 [Proteobacteria bacterium]|nr:MAG: hypothetical protein EOP06_13185 [Pseudomonadota bacterium]